MWWFGCALCLQCLYLSLYVWRVFHVCHCVSLEPEKDLVPKEKVVLVVHNSLCPTW